MIVAGIPAYNEEKSIAKVILLTQNHVDRVIVCDDGSTDLTAEIAQALGAVVVGHEGNFGYGAAIRSLFKQAKSLNADVMITLDADGQHDPEDIPKLLKSIENNEADIVIGSRFLEKAENEIPRYRRLGIKLLKKMSNGALKDKISDAQSGFRAYNKKAIRNLELQEDGMGVSAEILMKAGRENFKVVEVPVGISYKGIKTSTHNPFRHGLNVMSAIFRLIAHERPLEFLGVPGTVLFLAGVLMAIVFHYQFYITTPRIFVPIIFFSSTALVLAGILLMFTAACARTPKPLLYLGIPGAVSLLTGFYFGICMLLIYMRNGAIIMNIGMASLAFILIGLFTVSTAITIIHEHRPKESKRH